MPTWHAVSGPRHSARRRRAAAWASMRCTGHAPDDGPNAGAGVYVVTSRRCPGRFAARVPGRRRQGCRSTQRPVFSAEPREALHKNAVATDVPALGKQIRQQHAEAPSSEKSTASAFLDMAANSASSSAHRQRAEEHMKSLAYEAELDGGDGLEPARWNKALSSVEDFYFVLQPKGCGSGPEPRRDDLHDIMRALVSIYAGAGAQQDIQDSWLASMEEPQHNITGNRITDLLLEKLRPQLERVLRKFGMVPSDDGLKRLQNAVQRRICEGDLELKTLANSCMGLLGLPQVEYITQEVSSQEVLFHIEDENSSGSFLHVLSLLDEIRERGHAVDRVKMELFWQMEARRPVGDVHVGLLATWSAWERIGLPDEFGTREDELTVVTRLHRPSASALFQHVMMNQPVVITGALDEKSFPPLRDFKNFNYLKARCGNRFVKMKGDASWDDSGRQVFINDPAVAVPLPEFLDMLEDAEQSESYAPFYMAKVRLDEEAPEMVEDIEKSSGDPWRLFRDCFGPSEKGVNTYFGCGRNTTAIHCDPSENILVVISGTKTFDLYPPSDADCLYTTMKKPLNTAVPPFTSPKDMPADVEERYPLYCHARPTRVELVAGDILYLPIFWWHAVTGGSKRNMTLVWWSSMHPDKLRVKSPTAGASGIIEFFKKHYE